MKITVILPSRSRPAGMIGVISAYQALSTGNNDITYVLILDEDDQVIHHTDILDDSVKVIFGQRNRTVNARFNEAVEKYPAECYIQACDDAFPLSFHWDAMVAHAIKLIPAFSWQEKNDPQNATYICLSDKWIQETGRFYPEYFPFWFADTWIAEVHLLAFGKPIPVINQLQVGGKRGKTQGMRDLRFWFEFFTRTRVERLDEAKQLAAAYGTDMGDRAKEMKLLEDADRHQLTQIDRYEGQFQTEGEPSALYARCKKEAEQWI